MIPPKLPSRLKVFSSCYRFATKSLAALILPLTLLAAGFAGIGLCKPSLAECNCPFCSAASQTLRQESLSMDAVAIASLVSDGRLDIDGNATFLVERVLRGDSLLAKGQKVEANYFGPGKTEKKFLLLGVDPRNLVWSSPLPLSADAEKYMEDSHAKATEMAQLLAGRFKLVAGVSDEHRNLLRTEQELEMDEREHTSSFLAALTENEARIRALHRLATEDPENVAAALQAHMQAVSAELELAKRKVEWFPSLEVPNQELIVHYVIQGFGAGLTLTPNPHVPAPAGTRRIPLTDFPVVPYGALWLGNPNELQLAFTGEAAAEARVAQGW
jgi:hypothetical protein